MLFFFYSLLFFHLRSSSFNKAQSCIEKETIIIIIIVSVFHVPPSKEHPKKQKWKKNSQNRFILLWSFKLSAKIECIHFIYTHFFIHFTRGEGRLLFETQKLSYNNSSDTWRARAVYMSCLVKIYNRIFFSSIRWMIFGIILDGIYRKVAWHLNETPPDSWIS